MKKQISPKIVSLIFSVLVVCFAVGFYAFAVWTGPKAVPPGENTQPPCLADGTNCPSQSQTVYKMTATPTNVSKTLSYNCPEGTKAVEISCKKIGGPSQLVCGKTAYDCSQAYWLANTCVCSVSGVTATVKAYCLDLSSDFSDDNDMYMVMDSGSPGPPCEMQFICGQSQIVP